jgi:MFS transporter, DHA1 family, multidrug resistance protein
VSGTLVLLFVPPIHTTEQKKPSVGMMFGKMGAVTKDKKFVMLTVVMAGFFYLSTQINITVTLEAVRLSGNQDSVGLVYLINSGLAVTLQFILVKTLSRWFKPLNLILIGMIFTTVGMSCFSFATSFAGFIVFLVIFSIGRMFVEPVSSSIVVDYAGEDNLASYFGFSALSVAVGGMLGNLTGGWLFDLGYQIGFPALCWVVFGIVGLFVIGGTLAITLKDKPAEIINKIPEVTPVSG